MVDAFLCYTVATGIAQFLYVVFVGTFPFNSFLSGFFCHVALFALGGEEIYPTDYSFSTVSKCCHNMMIATVSLRLQLTSSSEFQSVTPEKAYGDFAFCCLVLFFVVFSFMG